MRVRVRGFGLEADLLAVRCDLAHEVRRHVHVAAKAVRVAEERQRARRALCWRLEPAARGRVGEVAEQKGEPELAEPARPKAVGSATPGRRQGARVQAPL